MNIQILANENNNGVLINDNTHNILKKVYCTVDSFIVQPQ